jgi:hypothetical protein
VPRGGADLQAVPLPRAPVGHRERGSVCTLCPRSATWPSRPRRPRLRVLSPRQRGGRRRLAVRQGPLRLPGRPRAERITARWSATAASCARRRGSGRSRRPPPACAARAPRGRVAGGRDDQRGGLPPAAPLREVLGSPHVDSSPFGSRAREELAALGAPSCRPPSRTSSTRTPSSCSTASPSTTRRSSTCACARACAATASSSRSPRAARARWTPTRPCPCATRPGRGGEFAAAVQAALTGGDIATRRAPRAPTPTTSAASPTSSPAPAPTS